MLRWFKLSEDEKKSAQRELKRVNRARQAEGKSTFKVLFFRRNK